MNLAITTGAPAGWNPSQPLINCKPPYPTEDLIRRSALYQMMTQSVSTEPEKKPAEVEEVEVKPVAAAAPMRTRRRGAAKCGQIKIIKFGLES